MITDIKLTTSKVIALGLVLISCYFIYHTIAGKRGVIVMIEQSKEFAELEKQLENIRADKITLENKVKHLKPESLDLDLVEEQAKKELGFANQQEEIVITGGDSK